MIELNIKNREDRIEEIGDNHIMTSAKTPLREDAFIISDEEKMDRIQESVKDILITLGMDLSDDSLQGTPKRVAKAFVKELFMGLNPRTNQRHQLLIIIIIMRRCWLRKILSFILPVSTTYYQ